MSTIKHSGKESSQLLQKRVFKRPRFVIMAFPLIVLALFAGHQLTLRLRLAQRCVFAEEQIRVFYKMREKALAAVEAGRLMDALSDLDYLSNYYPSGTKQIAGSSLDLSVERVRTYCIREVIHSLRDATGKDLGSAPSTWIETYKAQRLSESTLTATTAPDLVDEENGAERHDKPDAER